jgi:hypothetical protein
MTEYIIRGKPVCGTCGVPITSGDHWLPVSDKKRQMVAVCWRCAFASDDISTRENGLWSADLQPVRH